MEAKKKNNIKGDIDLNKDSYVAAIKNMIDNIDNVENIKRIYRLVMYIYCKKGD